MMEKKDGAGQVNAVQGMAPVGDDDPLEAVAVGHPFQQFAGGDEGGVHRHHQGKAGQGRHRHPEGHPVEHGGVISDQVAFVGLEVNGGGQDQDGHQGSNDAHGQGQEEIGLANLPPGPHKSRGLDDRFHPGIGQDAEGDAGDEMAVVRQEGAGADVSDGIMHCVAHLPHRHGIQMDDPGDDEIDDDKGGGDENQEGEAGVFPDAQDVQAGHKPDDGQHHHHHGETGDGEKGGGVGHGAHRGNAGSEDVVHHDGGHRHKGDHGAQDQVGKGIDPAADEIVMFQDFGNLRQPGADEPHQDTGDGDEDEGAGADKPVSFRRGIKDGGELVHQGDDGHRQEGQPNTPLLVKGEQVSFPQHGDKQDHQSQIEDDENRDFHAEIAYGF